MQNELIARTAAYVKEKFEYEDANSEMKKRGCIKLEKLKARS